MATALWDPSEAELCEWLQRWTNYASCKASTPSRFGMDDYWEDLESAMHADSGTFLFWRRGLRGRYHNAYRITHVAALSVAWYHDHARRLRVAMQGAGVPVGSRGEGEFDDQVAERVRRLAPLRLDPKARPEVAILGDPRAYPVLLCHPQLDNPSLWGPGDDTPAMLARTAKAAEKWELKGSVRECRADRFLWSIVWEWLEEHDDPRKYVVNRWANAAPVHTPKWRRV